MKTVEDLIKEAVEGAYPEGNPKEKTECANKLRKIVETGQMPRAEDFSITPQMLATLYNLAYQDYNSGKYNEAANIFSFLCVIEPENADYVFALGACQHMLKNYWEALNSYMAAFYLDVSNPLPFLHISDCYIQMKKPGHAICSLGIVLAQAGDNPKYAKIKERSKLTRESLIKEIELAEAQGKVKK